jgi:hypothetical protein
LRGEDQGTQPGVQSVRLPGARTAEVSESRVRAERKHRLLRSDGTSCTSGALDARARFVNADKE